MPTTNTWDWPESSANSSPPAGGRTTTAIQEEIAGRPRGPGAAGVRRHRATVLVGSRGPERAPRVPISQGVFFPAQPGCPAGVLRLSDLFLRARRLYLEEVGLADQKVPVQHAKHQLFDVDLDVEALAEVARLPVGQGISLLVLESRNPVRP